MFYRKDAVLMAVAGILASAGFAVADDSKSVLTLQSTNTTVVNNNGGTVIVNNNGPVVVDSAPSGLLMTGLDKVSLGDPLKRAGLNIYGWVEAGYTYDHRHGKTVAPILPGPFNHEFGGGDFYSGFSGGDRNHLMLNQVDIRFEKLVRADKWDVGGLLEIQYGTDGAAIHSNGLALGNESYQGHGGSNLYNSGKIADDRYNPQYQVDITQAYVDVNVPVGNGLKLRAGKFVTLMGYETIDPRGNPFYSHSYLFSAIPYTHTGMVGFYSINDQWAVAGGFSRGWDQSVEDNNGCAIDTLGQLIYTPNKQIQATLNWTVGPENDADTSHYRTAIDAIVVWKATEQLKLGAEVLYVYDGGRNAEGFDHEVNGISHRYGDQWGIAAYAAYTVNDYATINGRVEKFHDYAFSSLDQHLVNETVQVLTGGAFPTINVYSATLGVTIHPFPKDPIGKNLVIRPEVRYSISEDELFVTSNTDVWKDQLTFGCDVIFGF